MALAEDLLAQSRQLAELDRRRPRQASLRRAVSTAYYALFHLLIAEAVQRMIPSQPPALKNRVSRAFGHGEMKQVCVVFRADHTRSKLLTVVGTSVSPQMRTVAAAFVRLQEERQAADYDPALRTSRTEALEIIDSAERAFRLWRAIRESDEANVFLAALAFGARWDR